MQALDLMTADPVCCTPASTSREVARLMREHDCGCVPVLEGKGGRVIGVVTDRDIACRCVAEGKSPKTPIKEIMTLNPQCCRPDDDLAAVEQIMIMGQVRRVPVIDAKGHCVGMIAQADLALSDRKAPETDIGRVVERISEPVGR